MYCKLTNQKLQTYNRFQWELEKWYRIPDMHRGGGLCSESWFHCYNHPLLAVLLNPIHANIHNPRLFRVVVRGSKKSDRGLKFGFSMMKLTEEIPLPEISPTQRIAFSILCAKQVCKDENWNEWADNWLNGKDRSYAAAAAANEVAAVCAAADADWTDADWTAADAAANAAYAAVAWTADGAAYAAVAAVDAAAGAAAAARAADINLIKLAKQAMRY